jgi:hypothetical protein
MTDRAIGGEARVAPFSICSAGDGAVSEIAKLALTLPIVEPED